MPEVTAARRRRLGPGGQLWWLGLIGLLLASSARVVDAQQPANFPVPSGWFYTEARGDAPPEYGFMVSDDASSQFWTWFRRFGGAPVLGYPISHRFTYNGRLAQAFQKAVFTWNATAGTVEFVNIFDDLAAAGKDPWLLTAKQVPPAQDWSADAGRSWPEIVAAHLALLDLDPAIRSTYFAQDYPIQIYGLPMGARDFGTVFVIRCQRAAFQRWKVSTPWASAGQVTIANGGDLMKEAGLLPQVAVTPATLTGQLYQPPTATPHHHREPDPDPHHHPDANADPHSRTDQHPDFDPHPGRQWDCPLRYLRGDRPAGHLHQRAQRRERASQRVCQVRSCAAAGAQQRLRAERRAAGRPDLPRPQRPDRHDRRHQRPACRPGPVRPPGPVPGHRAVVLPRDRGRLGC
ncbi:MAG: hypothetical protein KatS3mg061_2885 [Dehalococcoidia bacterium]|nr:MAG: hypothetical protein KatS3mg061_2885 [Dehalococcoidia bacterium]